ncbi:hypothetical protein ACSBR1_036532 [Camellia fascicularis]
MPNCSYLPSGYTWWIPSHCIELLEDSPDDFEGLDASVAHIANLLSTEPADIKLGIGGFSMGVATALYSATCFARGKYGNGIDYPVNLRAIVGLSGWLPGSSALQNIMHDVEEQDRRITGGCKACCIFAHFALSRNLFKLVRTSKLLLLKFESSIC